MNEEPVVTIQQGKNDTYLTFFCNYCRCQHTIPVIKTDPNDWIDAPEALNYTYPNYKFYKNAYPLTRENPPQDTFYWNGSLTKPSIGNNCVNFCSSNMPHCENKNNRNYFGGCHNFITDGNFVIRDHSTMLPVSQWPKPLPPPKIAQKDEE